MPMSLTEMDITTGMRRHRAMLLRCLSRLTAQGWVLRPDDGLDLIQDFFLTQWDGIARRYALDKGTEEGYVAAAFTYYAKRRIAEMRRWSNALRDSTWLARIPKPDATAGEEFARDDRESVARAMANLPDALREALEAYVAASGRGEREVAGRLKITRHRLRSRVADAFGRVAVAIGATAEFSPEDREIALLLWQDGLSAARVARRLGIPAGRVQETRSRFLDRLRTGLG